MPCLLSLKVVVVPFVDFLPGPSALFAQFLVIRDVHVGLAKYLENWA